MTKQSAGLLVYRRTGQGIELLLVHPGGPFWAKKDDGAWSIPKGEYVAGEDALDAARREFTEETGCVVHGPFISLGWVDQSRKRVDAWAAEGDCDSGAIHSNTFRMEWPPKSGTVKEFPEVDRAAWFPPREAETKLGSAQREFVRRLRAQLEIDESSPVSAGPAPA